MKSQFRPNSMQMNQPESKQPIKNQRASHGFQYVCNDCQYQPAKNKKRDMIDHFRTKTHLLKSKCFKTSMSDDLTCIECNIKKENSHELIEHFRSNEHILKEHKIVVTGNVRISEEKVEDLTCPTCNYVFIRKAGLQKHLVKNPNHVITNKNNNNMPMINKDRSTTYSLIEYYHNFLKRENTLFKIKV